MTAVTTVTALYTDALDSVRAMTGAGGAKTHRSVYRPYGEEQVATFNLTALDETKGFIGERADAEAGLQYLNARYYDPKLGMFIQPDWWEVTQAGVGTTRYGYSFNDPVNGRDPTGHSMFGGDRHERPDPGPGTGWSSDRLERERNGWHDSSYNWSRGSWNVKIGGLYISYSDYDKLRGRVLAEKPDSGPGARSSSKAPMRTGPGVVVDKDVTNEIVRAAGINLVATEDKLTGSIGISCAGDGFCGSVITTLNSINGTYGRYNIDIKFYRTENGVAAVIGGPQKNGGKWDPNTNTITVSSTIGGYWEVSLRHEAGHMLGLRHAPTGSGSVMSYDAYRQTRYTEEEVGRLIDAY